jgi:ligand-binding SRPBCC domain-containing protein
MRDYTSEPIIASAAIQAPLERVFALSTRVELVRETLGMALVDTDAPDHVIADGSRVHWHGWKFGLPTHHHTLITGFRAPHLAEIDDPASPLAGNRVAWFQDSQEQGRFAFFQHDHYFREAPDEATGEPITLLHDEVRFALPFGPPGQLAATLLLAPHIRRLCRLRFQRLQSLAEGEGWRDWVSQ